MKFLSTNHKKYIAAAAAAFAAIAIPAQATDCTTVCQNAAGQAAYNGAMKAQNDALTYCYAHYQGPAIGDCMNGKVPQIQAAYDQAYQQTMTSCMGTCH